MDGVVLQEIILKEVVLELYQFPRKFWVTGQDTSISPVNHVDAKGGFGFMNKLAKV